MPKQTGQPKITATTTIKTNKRKKKEIKNKIIKLVEPGLVSLDCSLARVTGA